MTITNSLGFDTATSANIMMEWNKDFYSTMKSGHKDDGKNNDDDTTRYITRALSSSLKTVHDNNNTVDAHDVVNKKRKAINIDRLSINERMCMKNEG